VRQPPADQHGSFDDSGDEQDVAENGRASALMADTRGIGLYRRRAPEHQEQVREDDLPKRLLPPRRLRRQREEGLEHT